jgi:hypothetical protein
MMPDRKAQSLLLTLSERRFQSTSDVGVYLLDGRLAFFGMLPPRTLEFLDFRVFSFSREV